MTSPHNTVGVVKYGPGDVRRELDRTNRMLATVNQDVWASGIGDDIKGRWRELYESWLAFYKSTFGPTGLVESLRDSSFDRAVGYQQQAAKFREYLVLRRQPVMRLDNDSPTVVPVVQPAESHFWREIFLGATAGLVTALLTHHITEKATP